MCWLPSPATRRERGEDLDRRTLGPILLLVAAVLAYFLVPASARRSTSAISSCNCAALSHRVGQRW
jgi:hypothetical protein